MIRWLRQRRSLRRIADLEAELGMWPPWHLVRKPWYDMNGGAGYEYRLPREDDLCHDWPKPPTRPPPKPSDAAHARPLRVRV